MKSRMHHSPAPRAMNETRTVPRPIAAVAALGVVLPLLISSPARAGDADAPALYAQYSNYNLASDDPSYSNLCHSTPELMPTGRQTPLGDGLTACKIQRPITHVPGSGIYKIKVVNGAPLPVGLGHDSGYAVFVTTVGSNAHCVETATTWSNVDFSLTSTITCVNPAGTATDANWVWLYRTDGEGYPQLDTGYLRDFSYARVNRGAPTQTVDSQSFSPFLDNSDKPFSAKIATGKYRVTFPGMNIPNSNAEPTTGLNNVIVQRTCSNDTSATCKRAVCVPTAWNVGTVWASNTTVDVSCYQGSTLVDVDFRVFVGNQSHSSQLDWHYAWANSPVFAGNTCAGTTQFKHRNVHETPFETWPTQPLTACKTGVGAYNIPFAGHGFYHRDSAAPLVSSRATGGVYCNVGTVSCGGAGCVVPPDPKITIRCYDAAGNPANALWNFSMRY